MISGYGLALALAFINFVAEPTEMVLWSYHLLEPWLYLTLQVLKSMLWTALAGAAFWYLAQVQDLLKIWALALLYLLFILTA